MYRGNHQVVPLVVVDWGGVGVASGFIIVYSPFGGDFEGDLIVHHMFLHI